MSSRIPPLLEPYLSLPPEASLILLTSVLGASSNWLILRYLHSALLSQNVPEVTPGDQPKVLLLSFMRDFAFWKENGRRLGLDLEKLAARKKFAFVDGLSGLFVPKQKQPLRGEKVLQSSSLTSIHGEIAQAIQGLKDGDSERKVLIVIDQIDLLLAAGGDSLTANEVADVLIAIREHVHATVVTFSADYPLVTSPQTPLEIEHAALLLSLAHQADFTMSLRLLDSGTARDVSGVVRITVGNHTTLDTQDVQRIEERELLYFVGGDGSVRVFERGQ